MIVLNGMPFIPYCLRSLYPYAHQIIVVEGAVPGFSHAADANGHSIDGTLEELRRFQREEDPQGKVIVVTAEDEGHRDGFWPEEKLEMSGAYAKRATGDWLWQVDADEFYTDFDMEKIVELLTEKPEITAVSFPQITFWGSPQWYVDGPFLRGKMAGGECHRIFRWRQGYKYVWHNPPAIYDEQGRDLWSVRRCDRYQTQKKGLSMKHYSLLFERQVKDKCRYYDKRGDIGISDSYGWANNCWSRLTAPFHVHNTNRYVAWLERYRGRHPRQIELMWDNVVSGRFNVSARPMQDVAILMRDPLFLALRSLMRFWPSEEAVMTRRGAYRLEKTLEFLASWYDRRWAARMEKIKVFS